MIEAKDSNLPDLKNEIQAFLRKKYISRLGLNHYIGNGANKSFV